MAVEIAVAVGLTILLIALAVMLLLGKNSSGGSQKAVDLTSQEETTECPLCGERLTRGVRVHSEVFPGHDGDLMRIHGCPHCWPKHSMALETAPNNPRHCPYCSAVIPPEGYVIAMVYKKPYRRTHVHVFGCTVCKPGRG